MNSRVLFVDDEEPLLSGIQRRFGGEFEIHVATSGAAALDTLRSQGPFAVMVTDMRMPIMDGLQLLAAARREWPEVTYIMLTGNQDLQTAVNAVNQGHVFRFLNKPCPADELKRAVNDGLRHYDLARSEKELLSKTFAGAVGVLTDVLSILRPEQFSNAQDVEQILCRLQEVLGSQERWEYKLAARLGLIGFALLDQTPQDRNVRWLLHDDLFAKAADIGQRLLERIPRLELVAKIIGAQPLADGEFPAQSMLDSADIVRTGATLLRASMLWDYLRGQGLATVAALAELQQRMPKLPPDILAALQGISPPHLHFECESMPFDDLQEGMVLASSVSGRDGVVLVSAGRRLTPTLIERIREYAASNGGLEPIEITCGRRPAAVTTSSPELAEVGA